MVTPLLAPMLSLDHFLYDSFSPKLASLDQNLESILGSFQAILSSLRAGAVVTPTVRVRAPSQASARPSIESAGDDWFDAVSVSGHPVEEGLITVVEQESESDHQADETSEDDDEADDLRAGAISPLLTMAPKRLRSTRKEIYPLADWRGRVIKRRQTLPAPVMVQPPSILAFLRKNVCTSRS